MIEQWIREAIGNIWGDVVHYATFAWLDPFWGWVAWLAALYLVVMLLVWLFGSLWPPLRWIGGVMLMIATFGLYAYSRGEADARAHDAKHKPKPKPKREPESESDPVRLTPEQDRWRWPW